MYIHVHLFNLRVARDYRVFAGLWFGTTKPDMSLFFKPVTSALIDLSENGFLLFRPGLEQILCRAYLLCSCFDQPAKAIVLNFVQFNGYWGCCRCLQKGMYMHYEHIITIHTLQGVE